MICSAAVVLLLTQSTNEPEASRSPRPIDALLEDFLSEHKVAGAAVAVAKDGVLLHAAGYGVADAETGEAVESTAMFRIASISKPLTAVTVLRLVDRGELTLGDRLVDRLPMAAAALETEADERLAKITLRHLLNHTAGWDRGRSGDVMFHYVPIRAATPETGAHPDKYDVARYGLGRDLDHDPGTRYAYSNFGYLLLGLILEERTGLPYADVVKREVLVPLGIKQMQLGRTLEEGRAEGEVRYHASGGETLGTAEGVVGRKVDRAYGQWNLEWMDAHGGWIASAPALVIFADAVQRGLLLSPESRAAMVAPPFGEPKAKAGVHYGLGWSVRRLAAGGRNTWHTGALAGSSTILVLRHDGYSWAILFNADKLRSQDKWLSSEIDGPMHRAVDATSSWPLKHKLPAVSVSDGGER